MATTTTFICSKCEGCQCLLNTRNCQQRSAFGDSGSVPERPSYCPVNYDLEPHWRMTVSPTERTSRNWLVENLPNWVDEHFDEVPEFVRDAAYGQLINPARRSWLRQINLLHLLANDDNYYYDDDDASQKAIKKATKLEIINDIVPAAFAAGVIYAYIRLKNLDPQYDNAEYPERDD